MNDTLITFAGWVGNEVTLGVTPNGAPVVSFRVGSTPRRLKGGSWVDGETIWYTVKAWRGLAENVAASVRLGQPVVVVGRLVADTWKRPDGTHSTRYLVQATSVGHDLTRGTATFVKTVRQPAELVETDSLTEVVHAYDESGPQLNDEGIPVVTSPEDPWITQTSLEEEKSAA